MPRLEKWQIGAIGSYLASCKVGEYKFVASSDEAAIKTLCKKLRATAPLGDLLSGYDVLDIVLRRINLLSPILPADYFGPLTDAPNGLEFMAVVQNDLVSYFESLPRPYFVYFPLQSFPPIGNSELGVTDTLFIVDTSAPEYVSSKLIDVNNQLVSALMGNPQPCLEKDTRETLHKRPSCSAI